MVMVGRATSEMQPTLGSIGNHLRGWFVMIAKILKDIVGADSQVLCMEVDVKLLQPIFSLTTSNVFLNGEPAPTPRKTSSPSRSLHLSDVCSRRGTCRRR